MSNIVSTNGSVYDKEFPVRKISKQNHIFTIQCKKCHHRMKCMTYAPVSQLSVKVKRCVYCGFSNNVAKSVVIPPILSSELPKAI